MIFWWGSQGKSVDAGDAGAKHCDICKQTQPFHYRASYTLRHLWFVFRWSTNTQYAALCNVCGNGTIIPREQVEAPSISGEKKKSAIPSFDRWGWAMGLGGIATIGTLAGFAGQAENTADAKFVAAPKIGDLYLINVDRLFPDSPDKGSLGGDYGVFRVSGITGQQVAIDTPKLVFNKRRGATDDIFDGDAKKTDYYEGSIVKSVSDLKTLHESGAISDVTRE
jgi:hypothetical protein